MRQAGVVGGPAGWRATAVALLVTASCGGSSGLEGPSTSAPPAAATPVREPGTIDAGEGGAQDEEPAPAAGDDSSGGCTGDGIVPDSTGFVASGTNVSGITGSWSVYTDCDDYGPLEGGVPEPGKDCSLVTSPEAGSPFTPQPGTAQMCTSGTTAQVLSDDQWPLRWGADFALDLDEMGGTAGDYNATAAGVRGFCFYVSGFTVPVFRVRFPSDQGIADRNWYQVTLQHEGWHSVLFADLAQVNPTGMPFDASKVLSIEFEIPASRVETVSWDFCVDGLVALH
jgi:hypothetical protein